MKTLKIFGFLLCTATILSLIGASCHVSIDDFQPELCFNNIDDNGDGSIDCKDRTCSDSCPFVKSDSEIFYLDSSSNDKDVNGTLRNATTIQIQGILPTKAAVEASITDKTWKCRLTGIALGTNSFELKANGKVPFLDTFYVIKK